MIASRVVKTIAEILTSIVSIRGDIQKQVLIKKYVMIDEIAMVRGVWSRSMPVYYLATEMVKREQWMSLQREAEGNRITLFFIFYLRILLEIVRIENKEKEKVWYSLSLVHDFEYCRIAAQFRCLWWFVCSFSRSSARLLECFILVGDNSFTYIYLLIDLLLLFGFLYRWDGYWRLCCSTCESKKQWSSPSKWRFDWFTIVLSLSASFLWFEI